MPLFPVPQGPPGMPQQPVAAPLPATPPPFLGGTTSDMISNMAMKAAMEPSTSLIRRALDLLDQARKRDDKIVGNVSMAIDMLRNGDSAPTEARDKRKDSRPSIFRGLTYSKDGARS